MLASLKVSNFAIIENTRIQFENGLNIISGETGAGKSILLKSLNFLMGAKASQESVRTGAQLATVEGEFDLSERSDIRDYLFNLGIECDATLNVRRAITHDGKSKIFLNDSNVTLQTLREVVGPLLEVNGHAPLIEMTGQFENRNLASSAYQLEILDQYCGTTDLRSQYFELYKDWKATTEKIKSTTEENLQRDQRLEFLKFQLEEINNFSPKANEDATLEAEIKTLRNLTKVLAIHEFLDEKLYSGDDSVVSTLVQAQKKLLELGIYQPSIQKLTTPFTALTDEIKEIVYSLREENNSNQLDPAKLDSLESRYSNLRKLLKKYGPTVENLLATQQTLSTEVENLENHSEILAKLKVTEEILLAKAKNLANDLHIRRKNGADLLVLTTNEELLELNMKGLNFHIDLNTSKILLPTGIDQIEFMIQTGSKDQKRSLGKFASGGELSRILLSLKRVLGSSGAPRTYLFDEVDSGVSGETSSRVGKKLKSISEGQQVICVTHLPQVAAYADVHFHIAKTSGENEIPSMTLKKLEKEEKTFEVARLMSGDKVGKSVLEHARILIKEATT